MEIHSQKGVFEAPELQELSGDERAIQFGIEAARAEEREVDDAVARCIAAQLHGGQASALYSLASTGNLAHDNLDRELSELYQDTSPQVREWASVLGTYALHRENRGSVDGWTRLWPEANQASVSTADDEAEARAELVQRLNAAAVTTLGQVATVVTAEGVHGVGAAVDDEAEPDTYPWTDAVRWRPDGGGVDELELAASEDDAVDSALLDELFTRLPDEQLGSREEMGWCGLLRHEGRDGGVILWQNQYGRRSVWMAGSDDELVRQWQVLEREYEAFQAAIRAEGAEANSGIAPEIWVGSLADYVNGVLHGVWVDATLEPEELADAVQFMLRNSYEADAEEWGVFDYDGFGHEVTSLLGEYPDLKTVSKIGQGIAEHGEAYAAWAAYVGPQSEEQLDRFGDHYLGEWESIEAYAEHLLQELDAYRLVDEAPEWLQPYIEVDTKGYARDLEMEMHVVEKGDGRVLVFDTHV
jgi:antirestriction protein